MDIIVLIFKLHRQQLASLFVLYNNIHTLIYQAIEICIVLNINLPIKSKLAVKVFYLHVGTSVLTTKSTKLNIKLSLDSAFYK